MCGECYPVTTATFDTQVGKCAPLQETWHPISVLGGGIVMMTCSQGENVCLAPLFIHKCPLITSLRQKNDRQFMGKNREYQQLTTIQDKLRWLRCSKGLLQREVAEKIGVTRAIYSDIESGITQHIPVDAAEKLAQLYGVCVTELMDAYNLFLYNGQAARIQAYRESLGLKRKPFARATGIPIRSLQEWESGKKVISRKSWERYFKEKA